MEQILYKVPVPQLAGMDEAGMRRAVEAYMRESQRQMRMIFEALGMKDDEQDAATSAAQKTADDLATRDADYVTETGTQGDWDYRKWKSGIVECWAHSLSVTMGTYSTWTTDLKYANGDINYPFTFASADDMDVLITVTDKSSTTEANGLLLIARKSTNKCSIRFVRKAALSPIYVNVYIRGTLPTT